VDRLLKLEGAVHPVGDRAKMSFSESNPVAPGVENGTVVSTVLSVSEVVTLNGKSRVVTRKVTSGSGAGAPSGFPVRLILHADDSDGVTLMQRVYFGSRGSEDFAGSDESAVSSLVLGGEGVDAGAMGRVSSASFPLGEKWAASSASWGTGACEFSVNLGYNDASNPFVHTYHPDHDNWDARHEKPLAEGGESYSVQRRITLMFSETPLLGASDDGWGVTTLGGFYTETISGLRSQDITVSGPFIIHQISEVEALTE